MFEKITKITSVGTVLLILLGVFHLQQRYYWYDIKIFDYLDASEILLSFSEILMVVFFCLMLASLIIPWKIGTAAGQSAVNSPGKIETVDTVIAKTNFDRLGCILAVIVVVASLLWIALIVWYIIDVEQIARWNALWFDGLYIVAVIAGIAANYVLNRSPTYASTTAKAEPIIFLWSTFIGLVMLFAIRDYFSWSLKNAGIAKYDIQVTFNDGSTISTNKALVYIDQSRNYIFFRHSLDPQNVIIPLENIKSIKMKQLHRGL